ANTASCSPAMTYTVTCITSSSTSWPNTFENPKPRLFLGFRIWRFSLMPYERELEAALEAAALAGRAVLAQYTPFEVIPGAPASISTDADRQAQEIILGELRQTFAQDAFCAEETTPGLAGTARVGERLWVIDPIDGTRGFARKNGEFSLMIAFVHTG